MSFSPEEVFNLDKWQRDERHHPFTCPNRHDGKHRIIQGDVGILVPTIRGWICQFCDYTQDWSHDFMKGRQ